MLAGSREADSASATARAQYACARRQRCQTARPIRHDAVSVRARARCGRPSCPTACLVPGNGRPSRPSSRRVLRLTCAEGPHRSHTCGVTLRRRHGGQHAVPASIDLPAASSARVADDTVRRAPRSQHTLHLAELQARVRTAAAQLCAHRVLTFLSDGQPSGLACARSTPTRYSTRDKVGANTPR